MPAFALPHIWLGAGAAPDQYGEVLLFNVIGLVTGLLADRLRRERDRHERAAQQLERMVAEARAHAEERLRLDRLATIGRLASGLAHEVRNPLGGLLGCLEILDQEFDATHPKREFFDIARQEVARLNALTTSFLEFAHPAAPVPSRIDLRVIAVRAAKEAGIQGVRIKVRRQPSAPPVHVDVDGDQVDRALVDIMRETTAGRAESRIALAVEHVGSRAIARLEVSPFELAPTGRRDLFEPFPLCGCGNPLTLATARRLIENQGGVVESRRLLDLCDVVSVKAG
jgi:nitrogen-specific signal transduction histidine kinase